ncbi:hypothetical protein B0H16DRAFT_365793 [Mycena metata]|uniref:Uncharacterized protein n=1 Tax=Mycena metata TaxID=1033252 RepID=A0AAD7HJV3_9AGAR|nr:hypothetical protein B0H16DRAFT_365793 [Mycena metata]
MFAPFTFLFLVLLQLSMTFAAPVKRSAIVACSVNNTTNLGADLLEIGSTLGKINANSAVNANTTLSRHILNAQLAIVDATEAANQLQRVALFPTSGPAPYNGVNLVVGALANAQAQMSMIQLSKFATDFANNTAAIATASSFLLKAIDQTNNLNCTYSTSQ